MPLDLQNSITELVLSLKRNGYKSRASYYPLFCVVTHLIAWNKTNGMAANNRYDVDTYMRNFLNQHFRNSIPMPNIGAVANRLMGEVDKIIEGVRINANNLNVSCHIN